jgi:hypothetical protein
VLRVKEDEQPMQKSEMLDKTEGTLRIVASGMFRVPEPQLPLLDADMGMGQCCSFLW